METQKIGKYEIIREIGKGAMGVVYEARDPQIGRQVAVKTIRFDTTGAAAVQEESQKRFIREAQSAGNLRHPHIVTIYEVGEDQGQMFIAMEYIDGESLEKRIAKKSKMAVDEVVALMGAVGDALDYAHRKGIIHRDIKPANILIDSEGRPRVVDFGIAHVPTSTITHTGVSVGTPSYMAPEQIIGQKLDGRADLFSLGVILYELLTLNKPFIGDNITTIIYKIMNEDPRPLREFDKSMPQGLEFIVRKALAKNPAARYQNARELCDDLKAYKGLEGSAAVDPTAYFVSPKVRKKSRLPLILAVGAVLIAAAAAVYFLTRGGPAAGDALQAGTQEASVQPKPELESENPNDAPAAKTAAKAVESASDKPAEKKAETPVGKDGKPLATAAKDAAAKTAAGKTDAKAAGKPEVKAAEKEPNPVRAMGEIKVPKIVKKVDAVLPEEARKAGTYGFVILEVTTNSKGQVVAAKVLRTLKGCDQAAIDAVKQWVFEPVLVNGKPNGVIFSTTVFFDPPKKKDDPKKPDTKKPDAKTDAQKTAPQKSETPAAEPVKK